MVNGDNGGMENTMASRITIRTHIGVVTATRDDERSLNWEAVYPWGRQTLYGKPSEVEAFMARRIDHAAQERGWTP